MSRRALEDEINSLKELNVALSDKNDDYEQKMYELKRQLCTSKAMNEHLQSEIESLQITDKTKNDEYLKKISVLEEDVLNLKQTNAQHVQFYETEVQNKNTEIKKIIEEMKSKPEQSVLTNNREEIIKYTDEVCDLKLQIEELKEQILVCESKFEEATLKNNSLENQITELVSELNEVKNCLQSKREELEESKELSRNLQDDIIIMQMEIDKYKSLPMETAVKGNSIFAEVDDYRVKLQSTLESMKKRYLAMKTQYTSKCQELQKLHMEYAAVMKVIEDKTDLSQEHSELVKTYERHFARLTESVKSLENELQLQKKISAKLVAKDWKCVHDMVSVTRSEVQDLQRKLNTESLGLISSESNHYKTKRNLKKYQLECMQLRAQIVSLTNTLEDLKMQSPPAYQESDIVKKSCLKTPVPSFTKIDDVDLKDDHYEEFSLMPTNFNFSIDDSDTTVTNKADYSIFNVELKETKQKEEDNKENIPEVNNTSNIANASMSFVTSKMRTVSFQESMVESEKTTTGKFGGRKVITAQPLFIPSIKRN